MGEVILIYVFFRCCSDEICPNHFEDKTPTLHFEQ